ncbi:DUF1176 domain-containing protein [Larsenimonas suaedae]|uniref:DUF1176 domain-containing protein n=1 Tax=Larsenimonas suaedae TaxID=1851019 RepID=A0ABU1GYU1_9GAMM|nr:DUF1176 domain-containing protein [Larsenimonas suaedae]MCM2972911.1 DUF1176 domain-containing protein [Larsenimonas suaedae]MDR5897010.1 DUF1176 domain-containing protein [Larsenimonas suaedae]
MRVSCTRTLMAVAVALSLACTQARADNLPNQVRAQIDAQCSINERELTPKQFSTGKSGTLWLVPCDVGAYQTGYQVVYQSENGPPRRLLFAKWQEYSWTGSTTVFDPTFDPETGVLRDQYKDRGVGDCGGIRVWQWREEAFKLLTYRARSCKNPGASFPVVFQAPPETS